MRAIALAKAAAALAALAVAGCHDLSSYSTGNGSYTGLVVQADFVLAGMDPLTTMCMTFDANHVQDGPGVLSTIDENNFQRFASVPFRPIPQFWQDPLSTFNFGEGRIKNMLYVATASATFGDGNGDDVYAVVSLMQSGGVEVRLLRGAPGIAPDGGTAGTGGNLFAVFDLTRQSTPCSY